MGPTTTKTKAGMTNRTEVRDTQSTPQRTPQEQDLAADLSAVLPKSHSHNHTISQMADEQPQNGLGPESEGIPAVGAIDARCAQDEVIIHVMRKEVHGLPGLWISN
jgi:hypothetical protein